MQDQKTKQGHRRRGSVMAVMLLCLLAIMLFCAALTRSVLLHHRHLLMAEKEQQSMWLAECGMERAADKLELDSEYQGELWEVESTVLGGEDAALVTIRVERTADDGSALVQVRSEYPRGAVHRVTYLRERTIDAKAGELP